jgi:putative N-acetylmannosamine-6-phosphate epimerase
MQIKKLRAALLAAGLFIAGWSAGQFIAGTAQAQADAPAADPNMVALMMGVASVAVDTEAAAIRINGVADRLAALERRVVQLEAQRKR